MKRDHHGNSMTCSTMTALRYSARALGDFLVVVLSSDEFTGWKRETAYFSYEERKADARRPFDTWTSWFRELTWGVKIEDISKYDIDKASWVTTGAESSTNSSRAAVEIAHFPRTPEVSTNRIKNDMRLR